MHSSRMHTARLLTISQHALRKGGVCPRGVWQTPPLWTEWQICVKTLPCRNFVAGGNNNVKNFGYNGHLLMTRRSQFPLLEQIADYILGSNLNVNYMTAVRSGVILSSGPSIQNPVRLMSKSIFWVTLSAYHRLPVCEMNCQLYKTTSVFTLIWHLYW